MPWFMRGGPGSCRRSRRSSSASPAERTWSGRCIAARPGARDCCPFWRSGSTTLVLATALDDAAVLTCERLLAAAVRANRRRAIDLFDVVRIELANGRLTEERGREICTEWDRDRFSAGRPVDYAGTFDQELRRRHAVDPLPF